MAYARVRQRIRAQDNGKSNLSAKTAVGQVTPHKPNNPKVLYPYSVDSCYFLRFHPCYFIHILSDSSAHIFIFERFHLIVVLGALLLGDSGSQSVHRQRHAKLAQTC